MPREARPWPSLPYSEWKDTYATLHMWTQVVGKIRLKQTPLINHWWNVPLYLTPRGLTTSAMPWRSGTFEIDFDFASHQLVILTSEGVKRTLELRPQSVAAFYRELMQTLRSMGIDIRIWSTPVEIVNPIPFEKDEQHASYDRAQVERFFGALMASDVVLKEFRGRFRGKCSPVHFFWGSFDLAVSRFSGRPAPAREGADHTTREAYSDEVSSLGWWPGNAILPETAYYSYTSPEPDGFKAYPIAPDGAYYSKEFSDFILPYESVRSSPDPRKALLDFAQSTYEAGANLGKWDRARFETQPR